MDPRRPSESSSAARATTTASKKKSASHVKVVASRYAQVLQSKNIESHAARGSTATAASSRAATGDAAKTKTQSTPSTARGAGRMRAHGPTLATMRTTPSSMPIQSARPKIESHTSPIPTAKRPRISMASTGAAVNSPSKVVITTPSAAPATTVDEATKQDMKERLKAYKANKSLPIAQRRPNTPSMTVATMSSSEKSKLRPVVKSPTVRERPTFPKRINTSGAERSTKRPAKVTSQPIPVETTVFAPRPTGGTTLRARASSISTSLSSRSQIQQTDEEELELLEAMYYQLCFTEMRAEQAFRQQEQSAEQQMLAAWGVFRSKLQLLHDTSLRLDREKHIQLIEENLADQALPSVQVAGRLPEFMERLSAVCDSLETSLHRLPTPGVTCKDPLELKRHIDGLTAELDGLLRQLHATNLDTKVSKVVTFERGMDEMADSLGKSLLQAANLVQDLLREVNAETSMKIQQIQLQRVTAAMSHRGDENGGWW